MSLYVISTNNGQYFNSAFDSFEMAKQHAKNIQPIIDTNVDVILLCPGETLYSKGCDYDDPVLYRSCVDDILIDRILDKQINTCTHTRIYVAGGNNGLYAYFFDRHEAIEYAKKSLDRCDIFQPQWMKVWNYTVNIGSSCFIGIHSMNKNEVWSSYSIEIQNKNN